MNLKTAAVFRNILKVFKQQDLNGTKVFGYLGNHALLNFSSQTTCPVEQNIVHVFYRHENEHEVLFLEETCSLSRVLSSVLSLSSNLYSKHDCQGQNCF